MKHLLKTMDVKIKGKKKNGNKNEISISEKLDQLTSIVYCWHMNDPVKNIENKTYMIPINSSNLDGWTFGNYRTVIVDIFS